MALQELALSGYMDAYQRNGRIGVRPAIKRTAYSNLDGSYIIWPERVRWLFQYRAVVEITRPDKSRRLYLTPVGMDILAHLIKTHQLPILKRIMSAYVADEKT